MKITNFQELIAWQLAEAFKDEVLRLVQGCPEANRDFKFRSQILDAAEAVPSDISEGFIRYAAGDITNFARYALASLAEAERRLHNGIKRGYWTPEDCQLAFQLCRRCAKATSNWRKSLLPFVKKRGRRRARQGRQPRRMPGPRRPASPPGTDDPLN